MSKDKPASVGRIAFWYTFSNFLVNGITFLLAPVFTRIMSKADYGIYSNYTAWMSLLSVVVTLNLYASISRAKYDFGDDIDGYLSSILLMCSIITSVVWLLVECNKSLFVSFFDLDIRYIRILFFSLMFSPAITFIMTKDRLYQRYKSGISLSILSTVLRSVFSVLLVIYMDNKLEGRIFGDAIPVILINGVLYLYIVIKGRKFSLKYIKSALLFSVPLVPHALSSNILISSDRIMIQRLCGAEQAAMYAVGYTASMIVSILWNSMNQAWGPWVYDRLAYGEAEKIKGNSRVYLGIFMVLAMGITLVMPEVILVMGGDAYRDAQYIFPPLCAGCICQFVYSLYVNLEYYQKKTIYISVNTLIAAGVNILLNYIFIPRMGYTIAAYTSFFGYFLMMVMHFICVDKKLHMGNIFDNKFNFGMIFLVLLFLPLCRLLYGHFLLRYGFIFVGICTVLFFVWKNRQTVLRLISRR